jgi:hypothetical protein
VLVQPRWAISWMKGPMTRSELRRALGADTDAANDAGLDPPSMRER